MLNDGNELWYLNVKYSKSLKYLHRYRSILRIVGIGKTINRQ